MTLAIITLGLIIATAFLIKNAKRKSSIESYVLVLIAGIATFLFEPLAVTFFTDRSADGGVIQIVSTVLGIYAVIWSIVQVIKRRKKPASEVVIEK